MSESRLEKAKKIIESRIQDARAAKSESKGWTCCGRLYEIREIFKKQD